MPWVVVVERAWAYAMSMQEMSMRGPKDQAPCCCLVPYVVQWCFRARLPGPESNRESLEIGPPAGFRANFEILSD